MKKPRARVRKARTIPRQEGASLFVVTFDSGHRVDVGRNGVTIWDAVDGRWLVDASTLANDNMFWIGSEIFDRKKRFPIGSSPSFPGSYLVKRKRQASKAKRAKRGKRD